jgi:hypothetical protein
LKFTSYNHNLNPKTMKANEKNETKAKTATKDQKETRSAANDQKSPESKKAAPNAGTARKK